MMINEELRQRLARELQRAVVDRHHAWRTPVLASLDAQGHPAARTVVLRAFDGDSARFRIYTDSRSPKALELAEHPWATLVFWSERLKFQLRVQARAVVHRAGSVVDQAWERMRQAPSAADYLSPQAPGTPVGSEGPTTEGHHLAVIELHSLHWDALLLSREGHRRTAWNFDGQGRSDEGAALVP